MFEDEEADEPPGCDPEADCCDVSGVGFAATTGWLAAAGDGTVDAPVVLDEPGEVDEVVDALVLDDEVDPGTESPDEAAPLGTTPAAGVGVGAVEPAEVRSGVAVGAL